MSAVAVCAALVLSASLLAAAIAKLTRPDVIRVTLIALGVPVRRSWTAVHLLIATEAAAAVLLLVAPRWPVSTGAVLTLFSAFAVAGAIGLRARTPIACACFGGGIASLGWRQIAQLAPAAIMAVATLRYAAWTAEQGLAMSAAALLGVAGLAARRVLPKYATTRAMRLSLRQARIASNELEVGMEGNRG
jgi:hypothetical protein